MKSVAELLEKYTEEDIQQSGERDFNTWMNYFQDSLQKMVDRSRGINHNPPTLRQLAIMDVAFVKIQMTLEEAEELIEKEVAK